jgi:[acyl-carrier-protein] S-malonyltransferase
MAKIAFVFPGQGSQKIGMGKDAFDGNAASRAAFEEADAALGESLSGLCFDGPEEALRLTANTQPALVATSIALLRAFGVEPHGVAGHSLGEYSANVAAGALAFADAVRVVRKRGTYMQEAVPVGAGAMAAVMGGDRASIEALCESTPGVVEPVNYNCPGQVVVAGEAAAVAAFVANLSSISAKGIPLNVSAPFHSSLMRPAEARLSPGLDALVFSDPRLPVYTNVDASPVTNGDDARDALRRQVSRAVRWDDSIARMLADGFTHFVEIGPGKVLTGLIGRISKDTVRLNVQSLADVQAVREALAGV